ncbi:carboxylate-amine ligase [Paractinoplanes atraurantiacus]|uniref:Putative glutamate--cysteine ligase 2 n=1 Tax=Paractinoplanes atraurantiacus TaxID=1036182 RepID=A0A285I261_9ACTN|nr:glutamate--cysteine ligase [Actinoplanes atraurantiacus]SNY41957.1 carboxylate-amine ligase [Actinoplanes atraurantiacus]
MNGPTVGVEEEFLLLDPRTGENVPAAPAVAGKLPERLREQHRREFRHSMIEMVTPVCGSLDEVRDSLLRMRQAAADGAAAAGANLVALGATPVGEPGLTVTDDSRYRAIVGHYGPIVGDPAVCGCHVHVGVPDRETAIKVSNHLRPWLPVVQAMFVNSPFFAGADTGHASWRSMQLDRWPGLGPTPYFESGPDLERTVRLLVGAGVMMDDSLLLWHARPSARYPTVEVRVADVCPSAADAVLLTALIRALVGTALDDVAAGRRALPIPDWVLKAAHWNAAHNGLGGTLLDPSRETTRPAWELVDELVETVTPALDRHGDLDTTYELVAALRTVGTGTDRLRREHERAGGDLVATLAGAARRTVAG